MKNATIRRAVQRAFTAAGDVAQSGQLIRKTAGDHVPGSTLVETTRSVAIRFVATEKPLSVRHTAADTVIVPACRHGLLECADMVPRIDDDLQLGQVLVTLMQVVPADLGAGILYEVTYQ
ncbi:hypothetical protein NBZ79_12190 [Sneathiella marina]|uniref:Uncharacterized protein n=1 Tax=Sneathiella marina TaxID=2950108 RepID=A0ABY4W5L6_9PROT|nr:hypothetical protein [Sneathiella marina]USG59936.1 hypothetical protein NBZ79_12190 [Sneathiella marina]